MYIDGSATLYIHYGSMVQMKMNSMYEINSNKTIMKVTRQ